MASSLAPKIQMFKTDTAVLHQYRAVKAGSDKEHVAEATANTEKLVGISQSADTVAVEDLVEVAVPGGGGKACCGGSVSFGDLLTATTAGKLIATTSNADHSIAVAMSDGVSSDVIPVVVIISIV